MNSVMQARIRKTKLFFENQKEFLRLLKEDLTLFSKYCKDNGIQGNVRLNGTSDICCENYNIINNYPELQFYDYTKIYNRSIKDKNYHITFSRSEITTDLEIEHSLSQGINVSVVFEEVPAVWKNKKVINGDLNDLRMHDDKGVIVGLKAKGMAKKNFDGFVIR